MDRDLTVERHLLSRSYDSQAEISALLQSRYLIADSPVDPYLVLQHTAPEEPKPAAQSGLQKNLAAKPLSRRKTSTRHAMKRYIKQTLAAQKRVVRRVQQAQRAGATANVSRSLSRYNIPRYADFLPLNALWRLYMQDLLFGEQKNPNLNMMLPRLSTADYNGCLMTVLESRDRNLVGTAGVVLYDSQHLFILVVPQQTESSHIISPAQRVGGLRVVQKRGTLFGFDVDVNASETVGFTILGLRFELRAVDRSLKKFKSHNVEDLY